jgi:hypothetical protein
MVQLEAVKARRVLMPLRNAQLGELLDTFLVCAAATIVVLRVYLEATGYPRLGGGGLPSLTCSGAAWAWRWRSGCC